MVGETGHNIALGVGCFLILAIISGVGFSIENYFRIGFIIFRQYVTFIPFLIGIVIDCFIVNKAKKEGNFIKAKFWLGFFLPLIVVLSVFGACWVIMQPFGGM